MDEDLIFWLKIWKFVMITSCFIIYSITGCNVYNSKLTKELIEKGADPLAAYCAINGMGNSEKCWMLRDSR